MANVEDRAHTANHEHCAVDCGMRAPHQRGSGVRPLERGSVTGETPLRRRPSLNYDWEATESRSLGCERKAGGKFLLRLTTTPSTIAYKYREGKVESTLERELNVPELVVRQAVGILLRLEMWVRLSGSTDLISSADTHLGHAYSAGVWWSLAAALRCTVPAGCSAMGRRLTSCASPLAMPPPI